jgi:hypothetical protein
VRTSAAIADALSRLVSIRSSFSAPMMPSRPARTFPIFDG